MAPFLSLFLAALFAASLPAGLAGPACSRKHQKSGQCAEICNQVPKVTPTALAPTTKPISAHSQQPAPPSPSPPVGSSSSDSDIQAYLSAHNSVRAKHGANPLTWSPDLASKAQEWANKCDFKHSGGTLGPFGENLAAGTGSEYGIKSAVDSWTAEVSEYDPSNPQPSHFTQVIWKGSTKLGCAVQSCSGIFEASFGPAKFYVCEYSAAGNVIGDFAENVGV